MEGAGFAGTCREADGRDIFLTIPLLPCLFGTIFKCIVCRPICLRYIQRRRGEASEPLVRVEGPWIKPRWALGRFPGLPYGTFFHFFGDLYLSISHNTSASFSDLSSLYHVVRFLKVLVEKRSPFGFIAFFTCSPRSFPFPLLVPSFPSITWSVGDFPFIVN